MSLHFDELFRKKLQKVPRFLKTHEKSSILSTLATFRKNYHVWRFDEVFIKKLQKVPRFVKKHEKSSIWPKLCNFSSKLPCFGISMKFSGKICKQCLISWKSTRNHRFQQNLQLFRKNYHVFAFRWTFQKKIAEIASFLEKARKIIDLAKTNNFSNKLPCFGVLVSFSAESCKKYCRSISGTSYNYGVRDLNLLLSPLLRLR